MSIKPGEDARLPSMEAEIESHWRNHRKAFVKELTKQGMLQKSTKNTALDCVRILQEYQNRGLGADQGREAIRVISRRVLVKHHGLMVRR